MRVRTYAYLYLLKQGLVVLPSNLKKCQLCIKVGPHPYCTGELRSQVHEVSSPNTEDTTWLKPTPLSNSFVSTAIWLFEETKKRESDKERSSSITNFSEKLHHQLLLAKVSDNSFNGVSRKTNPTLTATAATGRILTWGKDQTYLSLIMPVSVVLVVEREPSVQILSNTSDTPISVLAILFVQKLNRVMRMGVNE